MDELRAGVYRHYKGPLYLVLGLAHDANSGEEQVWSGRAGDFVTQDTPEREVVVYVPLYEAEGPRLAVRTLEDFFVEVCGEESCMCYGDVFRVACPEFRCSNRHRVPRFSYVGLRYAP